MKILTSKKGAVLMISFMLIIVVTIYLSSYVIWTIWDQRNLLRRQRLEEADKLARAGLNRAIVDLQLESDSWLDGEINGHSVTLPDSGNYTNYYILYHTTQTLPNGNYTVELRYLYDTGALKFLDKRMWVRSTGITSDAFRTLEQMVNFSAVKNLGPGAKINTLYANSQPAIDESDSDDNIGITAVTLRENVSISCPKRFNISGCYDPTFQRRSCGNYYTLIQGNMNITGTANVTLSGVTIE